MDEVGQKLLLFVRRLRSLVDLCLALIFYLLVDLLIRQLIYVLKMLVVLEEGVCG
jgi:hypothetical protein